MNILINILANSQQSFINLTRISIFIVMVWIGGLKAYQYEADGIVPFVINSPFMSFFYNNADKTVIGVATFDWRALDVRFNVKTLNLTI